MMRILILLLLILLVAGGFFYTINRPQPQALKLLLPKDESGEQFIVFIKADGKATYKNTVDMPDEMTIGDIKRYALVDLTKGEADQLGLEMYKGD